MVLVPNLVPNKICVFIAGMLPKISLAVALFGLSCPLSDFAAVLSVPPAAGGQGIQAALDSLAAGGEVDLSAGQYLIREPVILRNDHQTLRGCGLATVLHLADGANCPVVVLGSPFAVAKARVKDVRLADLVIDGNRKNQQKEVWRILSDGAGVYNNGVDVWGVEGADVEHVVCCRCRSGGMVTSAKTRHLIVRDYTAFDNQFDGLACYLTEDSDFSHLNLHDNLSAGISLDLNFNHNVIHDSVLAGNDLGIFMRQSRNNVFEGLTIQKSRHHGVFMAQTFIGTAAGWQSCPGSECSGNTFNNLVIIHCGGKGFLVNDVTCTNNVICGGQFADDAQGGLGQAAANLVTMQASAWPNEPARLEAAMPVVHQLPGCVPAAQFAPKAL
jgi:polygalacturonase